MGVLGIHLVPDVDLTASYSQEQLHLSPFNAVMSVAYATNKKKGDLVDVAKLVPLFKKISKGFPKKGAEVDGEKLVAAVKSTTKGMKNTDNQKLRKLSHNPLALFTSSALGAGLSRKFFETSRNLRMSPLSLMAIITYLEIHRQPSCSDIYAKCKPFPEQIKSELNNLYATTVASSLNDNVDWVGGREIGGAFHLAMLAKTQLSYEISGTESLKPIGAEVSKDISIVELDRRNRPIVTGESYKRRIDILLKGESGNDDILSKQNIWVEVKSIKYKANYLKTTWKPWNMKGSTYSYHRQFYLDRVGTNQKPLTEELEPQGADFQWWLQDFKKKTRRSYTSAERDKIATKLRLLPTRKSSAPYASVGYKTRDTHNAAYTVAKVNKNFKAHNVKNWVINDAKQYLFTQLDDKVIAELINE